MKSIDNVSGGDKVLVWTEKFAFTGQVISSSTSRYLVLDNAAWIPKIGRPSKTFLNGEFEEVEYFGKPVRINLESIIFIVELETLPTTTV
jgi:hypothetical protein